MEKLKWSCRRLRVLPCTVQLNSAFQRGEVSEGRALAPRGSDSLGAQGWPCSVCPTVATPIAHATGKGRPHTPNPRVHLQRACG